MGISAETRQRATWPVALALSLTALTVAFVAVGIGLAIANGNLDVEAQLDGPPKWHATQQTLSAVVFLVPGVVLSCLRPRNPFGWLLLASALGHALSSAGYGYAVASEVGGHHYPQSWLGIWAVSWATGVEVPVEAALITFYPDARPPRGWIGKVCLACVAVTAFGLFTSFIATFDGIASDPASAIGQIHNPIGTDVFSRFDQEGALWYGPPMLLLTVLLVVRWLRARGAERQLLKWLVLGNLVGAIFAPLALLGDEWFLLSVQAPALLLMPVLVAAALRHRVYGIDIVVQRAFLWVFLLLIVAAVYGAVAGGIALFAGGGSPGASFAAAVAAAFALAPARSRVEQFVNRMLFGHRDEPYHVLSNVGRRLEATGSEDDLLPEFVASVAQALRLPFVQVEICESGGIARINHGTATTGVERFPLTRHGSEIGSLVVGLRAGEHVFSVADRRLLDDLARQAAAAVARLALTADLRRSRERIVTAREEERRRLRRDLHDSLGPVLTGAAMLIDAARQTAPRDPELTRQTLREAGGQVRSAILDVRRLVYELRPPALDELGLVGALREQLAPFSLRTELRACEPFPELPAAVEVAAFRIVLEAVTNASRHSTASCCTVDLRLDERALAIEVADDGRSDGVWARGVGLSSMAERAAELGGTFVAGPTSAGTGRVLVTLPLAAYP